MPRGLVIFTTSSKTRAPSFTSFTSAPDSQLPPYLRRCASCPPTTPAHARHRPASPLCNSRRNHQGTHTQRHTEHTCIADRPVLMTPAAPPPAQSTPRSIGGSRDEWSAHQHTPNNMPHAATCPRNPPCLIPPPRPGPLPVIVHAPPRLEPAWNLPPQPQSPTGRACAPQPSPLS